MILSRLRFWLIRLIAGDAGIALNVLVKGRFRIASTTDLHVDRCRFLQEDDPEVTKEDFAEFNEWKLLKEKK